jgi:hypothetical protein
LPRLGLGDDEFDLDRERALQLEEAVLMQHAMPAEAGHRAERGTARDAHPVSFLQQPFP